MSGCDKAFFVYFVDKGRHSECVAIALPSLRRTVALFREEKLNRSHVGNPPGLVSEVVHRWGMFVERSGPVPESPKHTIHTGEWVIPHTKDPSSIHRCASSTDTRRERVAHASRYKAPRLKMWRCHHPKAGLNQPCWGIRRKQNYERKNLPFLRYWPLGNLGDDT